MKKTVELEGKVEVDIDEFSDKEILKKAADILRSESSDVVRDWIEEFIDESDNEFKPENLREEQEFEEFISRMENKRKGL